MQGGGFEHGPVARTIHCCRERKLLLQSMQLSRRIDEADPRERNLLRAHWLFVYLLAACWFIYKPHTFPTRTRESESARMVPALSI